MENVKILNKEGAYKKAIKEVELIKNEKVFIARDLMLVGEIYLKLADTTTAKKKVFESILKGGDFKWLASFPELKSIFTRADSLYFYNTYKQKKNEIDIELYSSIFSMFQLDQYVRKKWMSTLDSTYLDAIFEIDSIHAIKVYEIIDKNGWLGHNYFAIDQMFFPLFLHISDKTMDSTKFEMYQKKLFKEVLKGNMTPSGYAVWVDRHLVFSLKKLPIYGAFWKGTERGRELGLVQQPEEIDSLRNSIGLVSLFKYAKSNSGVILPDWYHQKEKDK